ncbi:MAG: hypothetical protein Q9187_006617 [Circinaria calcarea]
MPSSRPSQIPSSLPSSLPSSTPSFTNTALLPSTSGITNSPNQHLSTSGAFNGSGLATSTGTSERDRIQLFYQAFTGDLTVAAYSKSGGWRKSRSLGARNVFNTTSLAACYIYQEKRDNANHQKCRMIYLDLSGSLQDIITTNITNSWSPGNIGSYNFKAPLIQRIGLLVLESAYYGIGQTGGGLRLYVANEQGLIQEYGYDAQTDSWASGFTFPESNGYGGVSSEYRSDKVTTLYLVNKNSKLEYWWRDWDEDSTFPSGSWNKGKLEPISPEYSVHFFFHVFDWSPVMAADVRGVSINTARTILHEQYSNIILGADTLIAVHPNSSIVVDWIYHKIYYQENNFAINGISYSGYKDTFRWDSPNNPVTRQATPGTAIGWGWFSPNADNGSPYLATLYFQTNGSNVAEYGNFDSSWKELGDIALG